MTQDDGAAADLCILPGVPGSRRIERATYEDVGFRYLAADQHPDHSTIADFRQEHLASLSQLFVQVLKLCQRAGW